MSECLITSNTLRSFNNRLSHSDAAINRQTQLSLMSDTNTNIRSNPDRPLTNYNQQIPEKTNKFDVELGYNLSFCGCGFLGIYHVGVATAFLEYAPQSISKISGVSAGALVAAAHICGNLQLAYAITDFLTVAIDARSRVLGPFHPAFDVNANVREALERGMPEDVHIKATGRLHVSLTRVRDGENVIVNKFDSKEDVIQALLCSCFIPFWSGLVAPKFKGVSYIDGGFSNNLLILDDKTITVSPFAGEYDICPRDSTCGLMTLNLSNTSMSISPQNLYRLAHALLPSPPEVLSELCEQGFADGIKYLQRMNLISCTKCLEIRSSLIVSTYGEDMEEAFTYEVSHNGDDNRHYIRLEQQEQRTIEINGRRGSIVSMNSQKRPDVPMSNEQMIYYELQQQQAYSDDCYECVQTRKRALQDPLPKLLTERISEACDTVNKSLYNWICSHRPIKYLSYMAAPYYLPVDISLSLIYRWCWRSLPRVRSELVGCVSGLLELLVGILSKMDAEKSTSALLLEPESIWEEDAKDYEKEIIKHQIRGAKKQAQSINVSDNHNAPCCGYNVQNGLNTGDYSFKITNDGVCVCRQIGSRSSSSTHLHSLDDTFDSIVDETSNQDARVFAYYFRDAKNRLQVTEIFDRQRTSNEPSLQSSQQSLNLSYMSLNQLPSQNQLNKSSPEHSDSQSIHN